MKVEKRVWITRDAEVYLWPTKKPTYPTDRDNPWWDSVDDNGVFLPDLLGGRASLTLMKGALSGPKAIRRATLTIEVDEGK